MVVPPKEQREDGVGWLLLKAMYGTRTASKMFGNFVVDTMVSEGHEQIQAAPMTFRHKGYDYSLSVHGDDFVAEGEAPGLDKLDATMARYFDVKRLPRIGPSEYGGEATSGQHLGCTISWTSEGFHWEGNIKNVEDLMELMQFNEKTKGATTPSCKETGKGVRSSLDELTAQEASYFRTCAGTLQYIAQDCLAIKQAACEVMGGMATPLRIHQLRLVRVARYLRMYPGEKWHYYYQPEPTVVDEYCDSDWAGDVVTRRSVSCVVEKWGQHVIDVTVSKQKTIALSSGESEFYAITLAGVCSIQTKALIEGCGMKEQGTRVHSDSSAARGIVQRQGPGRLRHLDIRELWMQEYVRRKRAEVVQVPTEINVADIGTKPLPQARLEALLRMLPVTRREGMSMKRGVAALTLLGMVTAGEPWHQTEEADARDAESAAGAARATTTIESVAGVVARTTMAGNNTRLYHELVKPEFAAVETTHATTYGGTKLYWSVLLYLIVLHAAAAYGCRSWWRSPRRTARHKADDSTEDSDGPAAGETPGAEKTDEDKEVLDLMRSFTVDELRCLLRERGLRVGGNKADLIERFLGQESRATNRQLAYMAGLKRRHQGLEVRGKDVDSKQAASGWIKAALRGRPQ